MLRHAKRSVRLPVQLRPAAVAVGLLVGLCTPSGAQPPAEAGGEGAWEQRMAAARAAEKEREWQGAAEQYREALRVAERFPAEDLRRVETLEALGGLHYWHFNNTREALPFYEQAAEIRLATGTTTNAEAGDTWEALRRIYRSTQAWEKAAWAGRYELRCREAQWGEDSPRLTSDLTYLGWLVDQARPGDPEAEELILRALGLVATLEQRQRAYAAAGRYYLDRGRYEEASDYFAQAIVAHEDAPVPFVERLVSVHEGAGQAYAGAGQAELAEASFRTAVALQEEKFGAQHPALVRFLYRLGKFLADEGRPEEALSHLERAVALADVAWGSSSVGYVREELRRVLDDLGRATPTDQQATASEGVDRCCDSDLSGEIEELRRKGELEAAVELARTQVESRQATHGADSRPVADAWGQVGLLLWSVDAAGSVDAFERQLEILEQLEGTSPAELARVADRAAYQASVVEDYERAEIFRLVQIESLRADGATASLAEALEDLGHVRSKLDRHEEAVEDFRRAAEIWSASAGEMSPDALEARRWMAWSLIRAQRFREAEELLVADLNELEDPTNLSQESSLALERVLYALIQVFEKTDRQAEARALKERRRALMAQD